MSNVKAFSRIITDETLLESARHGSAPYPFQYYYEDIWDFDFHCVDWHWHPEWEYVQVQSGQAVCFVGEEKVIVSAGCGLLVNSRVIHRFEAKGSTVIPNAVYSPSLLAPEGSLIYRKYLLPYLEHGPDGMLFDPAVPWQGACIRLMREVFALQESPDAEELETVRLLLGFWGELHRHWQPAPEKGRKTPERTNRVRLQIMMQYIHEHYREDVRLEDIAAAVHVSRSTALQIFRQGIRQAPVAYLIRCRLRHAAGLLRSTEKKISAIAEETGFESSTYFCRKFRELYGVTPKAYREKREPAPGI